MRLLLDYRYSAAIVGDRRYSIIRLEGRSVRVREVLPTGQPILWEEPMEMTERVLRILAAEVKHEPTIS